MICKSQFSVDTLTLIILLLLIIANPAYGTLTRRRLTPNIGALWNLEGMTECKLKCSAAWTYNDYGCWCGVGGSHEPMDGIDTCCMHHDACYDYAVNTSECYDTAEEYIDYYSWSCTDTKNSTGATCKEPMCSGS